MALSDLPSSEVCGLSDSVLVFFDPSLPGYAQDTYNEVASPWIDLDAAGLDGSGVFILEFDRSGLDVVEHVGLHLGIQYFPDTCSVTGIERVSLPVMDPQVYTDEYPHPNPCRKVYFDLSDFIPDGAREIRLLVGVFTFCLNYPPGCSSQSLDPWIDNVRLLASNFTAIQPALDAAATGDTVVIPPGHYSGPGNFDLDFGGKNLILYAPYGPELTTIDADSAGRGFVFHSGEDSSAIVDGFTIESGFAGKGGGVFVTNGSHPTFTNCELRFCNADTGGAVAVDPGSSIRLSDSKLFGNEAVAGGAVFVRGGEGTIFSQFMTSRIYDNGAQYGGGFYLSNAQPQIEDCEVTLNTSTVEGGGVYAGSGTVVRNVTVSRSQAPLGGGIALVGSEAVDCVAHDNSAQNGGGFYLEGASTVTGGEVFNNTTEGVESHGGGVFLNALGVVDGTVIRDNTTEISGYGEPIMGGGVAATGGIVRNALILRNTAEYGGGVALIGPGETVTVEHSTVSFNDGIGGRAFFISYHAQFPATINLHASIARFNYGQLVGFGAAWGVLHLTCSATDSLEYGEIGIDVDGPQVYDDPLFCNPSYLPSVYDKTGYKLMEGSLCLPTNNACGILIGALGSGCATTGIPEEPMPILPIQAAPNPFNGEVRFLVAPDPAGPGPVRLKIFDITGRLVRELQIADVEQPVVWDGRDGEGRDTAPGVYFARASTARWSAVTRVVRVH